VIEIYVPGGVLARICRFFVHVDVHDEDDDQVDGGSSRQWFGSSGEETEVPERKMAAAVPFP
jgi:hypothetical protein